MLFRSKNDIDGKVMQALQQGTLSSEDWAGVDEESLPKLLQDRSLGHITNGRYYRLENVYRLLQLVLDKKIEIYITPSTFLRLTKLNNIEEDFLEKNIVNLSIRTEDASEIYNVLYDLVLQYIKAERKLNPGPSAFEKNINKAFMVAEAVYCGFSLVTNDMTLVHITKNGYEMSGTIKDVNQNFTRVDLGVKSKSKKGNIVTPTTMTLSSFLKTLEEEKYYFYADNRELKTNQDDNTMMLR